MCKVRYAVHSATAQPFETTVELKGGQKVQAAIPGLVVELVAEDGTMTHTLKFVPEDMEHAVAEFAVGAIVEATFAQVEAPPAAEDEAE